MSNIIYLLQLREFIGTDIYKIGQLKRDLMAIQKNR
jgi:hypothetical protein